MRIEPEPVVEIERVTEAKPSTKAEPTIDVELVELLSTPHTKVASASPKA